MGASRADGARTTVHRADTAAGDVRALADEVHALRMAEEPFEATVLGVPGHDAEVPDVSRGAVAARRTRLLALLDRAVALEAASVAREPAEQVTLAATSSALRVWLATDEAATIEHTVSSMGDGPSAVLLVASRTSIPGPPAAADFLGRVQLLHRYLDGCAERLREGARDGRVPVARLVEVVLHQVDGYLESAVGGPGDPLAGAPAPVGWDGAGSWRAEVHDAVRDSVRPAFARYRRLLAEELLPISRPDDQVGLGRLPRGEQDYLALVGVHTTVPLTPEQVHRTGIEQVAELSGEMERIGRRHDLHHLPDVLAAARAATASRDPQEAMAEARVAVARAEAQVPRWFPAPLPPACAVEPMSEHLATAGLPPMYFPPARDAGRPGAYLFNALRPSAGVGWDLEATAYHEAVPGHHLQLSRAQLQSELPALQRDLVVTAAVEGWGLYAEHLAAEMGLYSSDFALLGALAARMMRAARLVVDTGLHALGWSHERALTYLIEHVAMPEAFLAAETNRYIGLPAQALSYYVGYQELLRLRAEAERRATAAGDIFDIRGFHGAVLDAGSVPLPALGTAVAAWLDRRTE